MVVMASIHMHRRNTSRALSTVDIPESTWCDIFRRSTYEY